MYVTLAAMARFEIQAHHNTISFLQNTHYRHMTCLGSRLWSVLKILNADLCDLIINVVLFAVCYIRPLSMLLHITDCPLGGTDVITSSEHILWCKVMSDSNEIALRWMSHHILDDESKLAEGMAWCCQATNHYMSQCWPSSVSPYGRLGLNELTSVT